MLDHISNFLVDRAQYRRVNFTCANEPTAFTDIKQKISLPQKLII